MVLLPCVAVSFPPFAGAVTKPVTNGGNMPRKRRSYIVPRNQGGVVRYYGDFRQWADVGGKVEALKPKGSPSATTDEKLAQILVAERIQSLEDRRRRKQVGAPEADTYLVPYCLYHLKRKRASGKVSAAWLDAAAGHLEAAITYFCNGGEPLPRDERDEVILDGVRDREINSITTIDVQDYAAWLAERDNGRAGKLSPSSQRKYLNSLSNLYARAASENKVPPGYNPVAALLEKPQDGEGRSEAKWLEVDEAALLLESARTYEPIRRDAALAPRVVYTIIATMLLTGGRPAEVLGLEVADISFERRRVTFRENGTRARLKTAGSRRSVTMWPQLQEILTEYLESDDAPPVDGPLFPSARRDGRVIDIRKALDAIAVRAGWPEGEIRPYAFRHSYTAARLQTLDAGRPISVYTVARELGHGGQRLVERVYGHIGELRHRSDVVEYRVEQHISRLKDRLVKLRELEIA